MNPSSPLFSVCCCDYSSSRSCGTVVALCFQTLVRASIVMRLITRLLSFGFILASALPCVWAQTRPASVENQSTAPVASPEPRTNERATSTSEAEKKSAWIWLTDGRRIQVDEVTETKDGMWYKRGNISEFVDPGRIKRIEHIEEVNRSPDEIIRGSGNWSLTASAKIDNFFVAKFARHLPLTAYGQSELHTRWGLDHHQGMDVG